ncbi:aldehyde dehydrogenase family protein [Paraburkholderia dipogonis]|uniref:Aldehyde dehydrogenase family protein n=1 Tax=Paraburkholderia dipogonis TaxID=1211383 RepID=A0A4Y8MGX5_9BURK|nr:aldehyde dehydrogenase family protein [Paraburkholderia dipogonis]TFE36736.1 aldehyde dehydrogenase family protein [Paraburkholderia dipogonis]
MRKLSRFYIDGHWVTPLTGSESKVFDVYSPVTEQLSGQVLLGSSGDVDNAVRAAKKAFESFSATSKLERIELLRRIAEEYRKRHDDFSEAVAEEIGCPPWLAKDGQFTLPEMHLKAGIDLLDSYQFEHTQGTTLIRQQPVGVCGLITPWNWPILQIMIKLAPALATGCTVVWKPSEYSPFSAQILAEVLDAAAVPPGVFNMVFGDGSCVGHAISSHADVAMVSVTGSTRAGIEVARQAALTVKRVHQELGGKGPNILLEDADFETAITSGVQYVMLNSGQNCTSPTRLLVPRSRLDEAEAIAMKVAKGMKVGPPEAEAMIGPVANKQQWERVQHMIQRGIDEGARLVLGGTGRPEGVERGYFVRPTIFSDVSNQMAIAQEEIFGPVLSIIPYDSVEDAISMANDSEFGLAAYVHSARHDAAMQVASRIVSGQIYINGDMNLSDVTVPFGGRKMSGNGKEFGAAGFEAFTESVAYLGFGTAS